jgi:amidase
MTRTLASALALALLATASPASSQQRQQEPDAATRAAAELQRIAELDDAGPQLNAVIAVNPAAPQEARRAQNARLPLAGRTVLVKDNIETRELPTTAGSLALANNNTGRDAPLVARLRAAGGVVLGKTNLSEWANIRDDDSTSGWSSVGGLTRNPHAIDRNACGSSSGSGAAVAAGFAWAAIGTETNGSITCPASANGVVGFKPTVGLVSRTHVVPISSTQDTPGPMARTVKDAAMLLTAIAGSDPADPATAEADRRKVNYAAGLERASLRGVRIGVLRNQVGARDDVKAVFEQALADMKRAGAILVDIQHEPNNAMYGDSYAVLLFELREEMGKYLRSLPGQNLPRSLADLIASTMPTPRRKCAGSIRTSSSRRKGRPTVRRMRKPAPTPSASPGQKQRTDSSPSTRSICWWCPHAAPPGPPTLSTATISARSIGFGSPAAIAGYPHLTVPMGAVERLPVGISFLGGKWQDAAVLRAGAAYEKVRSARVPEPTLTRWEP